jgi:hypothetical protein
MRQERETRSYLESFENLLFSFLHIWNIMNNKNLVKFVGMGANHVLEKCKISERVNE